MDNNFNHFSEWLEKKEFLPEEKTYFIKDVNYLMDKAGRPSLRFLNQELEDFGWGVQILDEAVFNQMVLLHRHKF